MDISIFNKSDSEMPMSVSKQPAKAEDISFEEVMKFAASLTVNGISMHENSAVSNDHTAAAGTEETATEITAAAKEGAGLKGSAVGKVSVVGKDGKKTPLSRGLTERNACVSNSGNLYVKAASSPAELTPVELTNNKPPANETESIAQAPVKSLAKSTRPTKPSKSNDGKVMKRAPEEAKTPTNIYAPPALSQDEPRTSGVEGTCDKNSTIMRSSGVTDVNVQVSKKTDADISTVANLNNADSSTQLHKKNGKNTGDAIKDLSAGAIAKGGETLNSANKDSLKSLREEKTDDGAQRANKASLHAKKQDSKKILPAPQLSAEEPGQGKTDKIDSGESFDTSKKPIEDVTPKDKRSFEYGKTISIHDAKDKTAVPLDGGGSKARSNPAVLDAGAVNETYASTGGQLDSKNEDSQGKKDLFAQTLKATPGLGQAHVNRISTNPAPAEVRTAQSAKEDTVFDKVADGLKMSLIQGGKEVRLSLHPEHLGKLNIKLTVEDKSVKARIQVDNAEVKGILESDSGRLKEFLSHQGFTLEKYSIELNQQGSNMTGNGLLNKDSWGNNEGGGGPYARQDSKTESMEEFRYKDTSDGSQAGLSGIDVFI